MSHGGDIERVARDYGIAAERILDFSANVNPRGLPARAAERLAREARDPRMLMRYPDPRATELRCLLSRQLGVAVECILVGAGADELIHAAVRALGAERWAIPAPGFAEYRRAVVAQALLPAAPRLIGATLFAVEGLDTSVEPADTSVCATIFNNPHNPTGACLSRAEMIERITGCTIVDEAFIDYAPECAITRDAAEREDLIAIRSLTKFYGCPGLRVGYAVAGPETARALAAQLPAWPVTTLAMNALCEAVQDPDYARTTLEENARSRAHLAAALADVGCKVAPSAANFLFIDVPGANQIRERLIREHGILVRECDSFEGLAGDRFLRVAVRLESENARLIEALGKICHS